MRHAGITAVVALALAACSGPDSRDNNRAADRAAAKHELEQDCRLAQEMGDRDPRCPQPAYDPFADRQRQPPPPTVPRLPPVGS